MTFKVVNQIILVVAMKSFKKTSCNQGMEEHITILKKLRDKCAILMKNNLEIYRDFWHKMPYCSFFLNTDDPVNG